MPQITLRCPAPCAGQLIPKIVLERWARSAYLQCLNCGTVWAASTAPTDRANVWAAQLRRVADEYAFDIRRTIGDDFVPYF